jgi:hypothetical protein
VDEEKTENQRERGQRSHAQTGSAKTALAKRGWTEASFPTLSLAEGFRVALFYSLFRQRSFLPYFL